MPILQHSSEKFSIHSHQLLTITIATDVSNRFLSGDNGQIKVHFALFGILRPFLDVNLSPQNACNSLKMVRLSKFNLSLKLERQPHKSSFGNLAQTQNFDGLHHRWKPLDLSFTMIECWIRQQGASGAIYAKISHTLILASIQYFAA